MSYEHIDILAILAMLQNVVVLRLAVLYADDGLDEFVVLLDAIAVPDIIVIGTFDFQSTLQLSAAVVIKV